MVKLSISEDGSLYVVITKKEKETNHTWDFRVYQISDDSGGPIIIDSDEVTIP